jgi:hypothetical protein
VSSRQHFLPEDGGQRIAEPLVRGRREAVVDPGAAAFARDQPGFAQDAEVMRNGWLIERQAVGEVADANLAVDASERGQDG